MRWLARSHGISIAYLYIYDKLGDPDSVDDIRLAYTRSEWMLADIYTKGSTSRAAWEKALELINIIDRKDLFDVIRRRSLIFQDMKKDIADHPNNVRPHKASQAAARLHEGGMTDDYQVPQGRRPPGYETWLQARRLVKHNEESARKQHLQQTS